MRGFWPHSSGAGGRPVARGATAWPRQRSVCYDENLNTEELTHRRIAFDTLNRDSDLVPFKTWT